MNKNLWVGAAIGILVGAAVVQTIHVIHDHSNEATFEERLRCNGLADKYVRDNAIGVNTVVVNRIEFSRSRSSCLVGTMEHVSVLPASQYTFKIVDLLTREELFSRICSGSDECAQSLRKQEDAFEGAH